MSISWPRCTASWHSPLDQRFWAALEHRLMDLYGPSIVRYDLDYEETTSSQNVRFSFYEFPVFWRLDLTVVSDNSARVGAAGNFLEPPFHALG
jgi:hypothetical protein